MSRKARRVANSGAAEKGAPQVTMVPIAAITQDTRYQTRALHGPTVKSYENVLRAGGELPPLTLGQIGSELVLLCGWHRLSAHEAHGAREVRAVVIETKARDALWIAARDNLTHGRPLSRKEKKDAFRFYIRARAHRLPCGGLKAYRSIARDLGGTVTHHTIHNWMWEHYPRIAEQMAKDGNDNPAAQRPDGLVIRSHLQEALDGLRAAENAAHSLEHHPGALAELRQRVDAFRDYLAGREDKESDF